MKARRCDHSRIGAPVSAGQGVNIMLEALIAVAFLVIAAIIGLLLPPTEAQIQAASATPASDTAHDTGHDHHGH